MHILDVLYESVSEWEWMGEWQNCSVKQLWLSKRIYTEYTENKTSVKSLKAAAITSEWKEGVWLSSGQRATIKTIIFKWLTDSFCRIFFLLFRRYNCSHQNSPSSCTVTPSFSLSLLLTLFHSSELSRKNTVFTLAARENTAFISQPS